jgi:hypothetical protein
MNYLKNTANNKTDIAQCLPSPGHVRNWYIIKFFLWKINNMECRSVYHNWLYGQVCQRGKLPLNKVMDKENLLFYMFCVCALISCILTDQQMHTNISM